MPIQSPFIIELSSAEVTALASTSRRYSAPYRDVVRARIVLLAAEGQENTQVRYEALAQPFQWKFTRADLARLLERLATRDSGRLSEAA